MEAAGIEPAQRSPRIWVGDGVKEPRVRNDGKCARQGCNRPRPVAVLTGKKLGELRRYAGAQIELDPFCSSACCRVFHGCPIPGDEDPVATELRSEAGRRGKDAGPLSHGRRMAA